MYMCWKNIWKQKKKNSNIPASGNSPLPQHVVPSSRIRTPYTGVRPTDQQPEADDQRLQTSNGDQEGAAHPMVIYIYIYAV